MRIQITIETEGWRATLLRLARSRFTALIVSCILILLAAVGLGLIVGGAAVVQHMHHLIAGNDKIMDRLASASSELWLELGRENIRHVGEIRLWHRLMIAGSCMVLFSIVLLAVALRLRKKVISNGESSGRT